MLPMFKRGLAHVGGRSNGHAGGSMARVALIASAAAGLLFLLTYLAFSGRGGGDGVNGSGGGGGLFCNSALRQRAADAERDAAAASSAAAALRAERRTAAAASASDLLRSLSLDLVVPLTNLSELTTARVLDAALAAADASGAPPASLPARLRAAAIGHQALLCAAGQARPSPEMDAVRFGNATLYVYRGNDIVSDHLAGEGHMWEEQELREFLWALRAPVPGRPHGFSPAAAGTSGGGDKKAAAAAAAASPPPPLAIDVGANIGWFMLNAAAAGARVAAFEAMAANVRLLRATLCANPELAARVALYGTGVGETETECVMISGEVNRGDGHTICGEQARDLPKMLADLKKGTGYEYASRGKMTVRRIDGVLTGVKGVAAKKGKGGGAGGGGKKSGGGGGGGGEGGGADQEEGEGGWEAAGEGQEEDDSASSFPEAPAVVKIDIEGFEEPALRGADGLLLDPRARPWFILTECNLGLLSDGGAGYMRFLQSRGYALSEQSFRGPFFTEEAVEKGTTGYAGQNLYCARRDWLDSEEGRRALGGKARYVGQPTEARAKLEAGG